MYVCMYVYAYAWFFDFSILDGGFVAAARFVHRIDSSFSISGALVDVNLPLLNSILEIPPPSTDQSNSSLLRCADAVGIFVYACVLLFIHTYIHTY